MDKNFIGREQEIRMLDGIMASTKAEFVAVYGRRRVGKTYLIQQFFNNRFAFAATGIIDGTKDEEMFAFTASLRAAGYEGKVPKTWLEAFESLKTTLERQTHKGKQVVYIDELPCFDTPKSGFVRALGYFWNSWAALRQDVVLIVCGSATSWMIGNIIENHGGLHDRTTRTIYLRQFTLRETELYLQLRGFSWTRQMVTEAYMMLGGTPYYLSLLVPQESLPQNIDRVYFQANGELSSEYRRLYTSLFKQPEPYMRIVEMLARHKKGLTRKELAEALHVPSSGTLTRQLDNLTHCDIVLCYVKKIGGKPRTNDAYYQLTDLFTLFHLTFAQKFQTEYFWEQRVGTPQLNSWQGLAFEHVCMVHISQIRHALGLDRIAVEYYSWRSKGTPGAQVDIIIERADRLVNLCEAKFTQAEYVIDAEEDRKMRNRMAAFASETKNRCGIIPTWITTYGLYPNAYAAQAEHVVVLNDLFAG